MSKAKLAAVLIMPMAFHCAVAAAQKLQPKPSAAKTEPPVEVKPQTQTPTQTRPPVKPKPQRPVAVAEAKPVRKTAPVQPKTALVQAAASDILPTACPTPVYAVPPGDVYGAYVPYVPPPPPIGCGTPTAAPAAASNDSHPNASVVQKPQPQPASLVNPESPTPFKLATDLALKSDVPPAAPAAAPPADSSAEEGAFVQPVPLHRAPVIFEELRPFRSYAIGFKGSTLGAGFEIATPLAGRINLRYGFNLVEFTDPFSIDGINYHAGIHLKSSQTTVDWFFGPFHVSPGILYLKNNMSAPTFVGSGQTFVLGTQTFLNSVDDPVTGSSSVTYPRTISPMLLLGYGNLLPRSGQHLSLPVEVGFAYTGAPQINLNLNGTACVANGCVTFSQSTDAQGSLKQEIQILNEDLKHYPIFPIVSVGLAYRF